MSEISCDEPSRTTPLSLLIGRFLCAVGQHDLTKLEKVSDASDKIGCTRCPRLWGMNHMERAFLPWGDVASLYEGPGAIFADYPRKTYVRVPRDNSRTARHLKTDEAAS